MPRSTKYLSTLIAAALFAVIAAIGLPGFASAATPLQISPTSGPPGTVITVTDPACGSIIAGLFDPDDHIQTQAVANGTTVQLVVPADAVQGEWSVFAVCITYAGEPQHFAPATFTVTAGVVPISASPALTG